MNSRLRLLVYFLKKDLFARYAGSGLGMLWTVLVPIIQISLFWLVFSAIMKARPYANTSIPYIYFLLSSFFFWLAFSEGIARSSTSIIENAEIIKKISFPHILLPVTVTTTAYLLNLIGFIFFIIVYSVTISFSPAYFFIVPVLALQFIFSLGVGILLASLMPYIRDISHLTAHVLQGVFFLSPVIYSIESIPEKFKIIFFLNPLTYYVTAYHRIILWKDFPGIKLSGAIVIISLSTFLLSIHVFRKLKEGFADVL